MLQNMNRRDGVGVIGGEFQLADVALNIRLRTLIDVYPSVPVDFAASDVECDRIAFLHASATV